MRHLDRDYVLPVDPDDALVRLAAGVAGLREATAQRDGPSRLVIREQWRPLVAYVVAIFLFPIGLLALLARSEALLFSDVSRSPDGTRVHLHGRGHESVCDAVLAVLSAEAKSQLVRE